jgi:hypothetical protein
LGDQQSISDSISTSLKHHEHNPTNPMSQPLQNIGEPTKPLRPCAFTAAQNPMNDGDMEPTRDIHAALPVDRSSVAQVSVLEMMEAAIVAAGESL